MKPKGMMITALLLLTACGDSKKKNDEESNPQASIAAAAISPDDYRKRQQAFADSVLNTASSAKSVVDRLGKPYELGSTRLRDTVAMLAANKKADCFGVGRKIDPYLAGTVTFWVNMSVIGSDVVRVQESQWTTPAGNTVEACLNQLAKDWKFDSTFGKPAAYIVQVQFK